MISFLAGIVKFKEPESLTVEVNQIGYEVFTPVFTWQNAQVGEKKEFFIYTHVREDEITFFGFQNSADKKIFGQLISVAGVGPRLALHILSYSQSAKRVIRAISEADVDFFSSVKGVGKKSAQRIIVDLKSKIGGLKELEFETEEDQELIEALKGLGFSREEIKKTIKGIKKDLPLEEKIRLALKKYS